MESTDFALTTAQKAMLASLMRETGQPVSVLLKAIATALEEWQDQTSTSTTSSAETSPSSEAGKPFWAIIQELADAIPEASIDTWPQHPEGMNLATADASDPQTRKQLMEELGGRMHRLSETAYRAGWVSGLEAHLPALCEQAVETGKVQPFGAAVLCPGLAARLLAMREKLGYWVVPAVSGGYVPYQPTERLE